MTANEAYRILGRPYAHYELIGLLKSLSHPSRATNSADIERLAATIWALRNQQAWSRECLWVSRNPPKVANDSNNLWTPEQLKAFSL